MSATISDLQKIRGIGEIIARRLLEERHDSYAKVVALGESGLKAIKGVNPKAVPAIIEQAVVLSKHEESDREVRIKKLKDSMEELRNTVQVLTVTARDRLAEKLSGKPGRKLTEDLVLFMNAIECLESRAEKRIKRAGKGLVKAEKRLEGLAEARLKDFRKGLKKARKALERVHS